MAFIVDVMQWLYCLNWQTIANIGTCAGTLFLGFATVRLAKSTKAMAISASEQSRSSNKQAQGAMIQAGALLRSQYIDVIKNLKEIASIAGTLSRELRQAKSAKASAGNRYASLPKEEFAEKMIDSVSDRYKNKIDAISDVFSNFVLYCPLWVVEREDEDVVNGIKQIESCITTFIKHEEWNSARSDEFCLFISGTKDKIEEAMKRIEAKLDAVPKIQF